MSKVDPFIHPIPKKLRNDPELRGFFEYFVRWAHDMWVRSGGGNDLIDSTAKRESYPWDLANAADKTSANKQYIFEKPDKEIITQEQSGGRLTAVDNCFVYLSNSATLLLPPNPEVNSVVYMTKDGSTVTVKGNGKKINGKSEYIFRKANLSRTFQYFTSLDEWRIR